jgi:predicted Zn-dependent peptidase
MINTKKLKCGVTLVMEHIPYVQSTSFGIWAKAGSVDEAKKTAGISHLIEHMVFKGTENRNAKEIAKDADKIGSHMNAFTGKESTCYYIKSLASNIDKSIDIMMDMFFNSLFDEKELEKEKLVIYEEMKMIEDAPEDDIHDIICDMVFKGNPLAQPIIGTRTSLSGINRNTIKKYIKNEYTQDSIVISIAGKFDEDAITDLIEEKLSTLIATKEKKAYIDTP